jgi:hypothetical protein
MVEVVAAVARAGAVVEEEVRRDEDASVVAGDSCWVAMDRLDRRKKLGVIDDDACDDSGGSSAVTASDSLRVTDGE